MQDGGYLRSRLGIRGDRQVADGYTMKVQLEQGINVTNGSAADQASVTATTTTTLGTGAAAGAATSTTTTTTGSGSLFDRQAWIGLATPYGEFRAGSQNTAIFYRGDYIDYGSRTLGSMVEQLWCSLALRRRFLVHFTRLYGLQAEAHYAIGGANSNSGGVSSTTDTSVSNTWRYINLRSTISTALSVLAMPVLAQNAGGNSAVKYGRSVEYHNVYANYDYGRGGLFDRCSLE